MSNGIAASACRSPPPARTRPRRSPRSDYGRAWRPASAERCPPTRRISAQRYPRRAVRGRSAPAGARAGRPQHYWWWCSRRRRTPKSSQLAAFDDIGATGQVGDCGVDVAHVQRWQLVVPTEPALAPQLVWSNASVVSGEPAGIAVGHPFQHAAPVPVTATAGTGRVASAGRWRTPASGKQAAQKVMASTVTP